MTTGIIQFGIRIAMRSVIASFIVILGAVQQSGAAPGTACTTSCDGVSIPSTQLSSKTVERVMVSNVEEAQWRGVCHSFCIKPKFNVSCRVYIAS